MHPQVEFSWTSYLVCNVRYKGNWTVRSSEERLSMALDGCEIDVKCIWYRGSDMKFRILTWPNASYKGFKLSWLITGTRPLEDFLTHSTQTQIKASSTQRCSVEWTGSCSTNSIIIEKGISAAGWTSFSSPRLWYRSSFGIFFFKQIPGQEGSRRKVRWRINWSIKSGIQIFEERD